MFLLMVESLYDGRCILHADQCINFGMAFFSPWLTYFFSYYFLSTYSLTKFLHISTLFFQELLRYDPAKRVSAQEALKHPYFAKED